MGLKEKGSGPGGDSESVTKVSINKRGRAWGGKGKARGVNGCPGPILLYTMGVLGKEV